MGSFLQTNWRSLDQCYRRLALAALGLLVAVVAAAERPAMGQTPILSDGPVTGAEFLQVPPPVTPPMPAVDARPEATPAAEPPRATAARSAPLPTLAPRYPNDLSFLRPPRPLFPEAKQQMQLVLRLSDRRVYLYRGETVEVSYPVAVGKAGWETPVGSYEVMTMIENPSWENPFTGDVIPAGPNNPLGQRWIGFWTDGNNFIGFHGTPNEGSVGRAASHGCVRMYNRDIQELFTLVAVGMPVTVEP
ncbi:MAG: L,D-transpeptidase [Cyanobacteria bacterium P01_A01_bin.135]